MCLRIISAPTLAIAVKCKLRKSPSCRCGSAHKSNKIWGAKLWQVLKYECMRLVMIVLLDDVLSGTLIPYIYTVSMQILQRRVFHKE
jgi:hypothetical protein